MKELEKMLFAAFVLPHSAVTESVFEPVVSKVVELTVSNPFAS